MLRMTTCVLAAATATMWLSGCTPSPAVTGSAEMTALEKPADELMPAPAPQPTKPGHRESGYAPATAPGSGPTGTMVRPAGAPATYTVQKGDSLYSIARKLYGDQKRFKDLAQANNISDPNKITVGQVLTVP